MTERPASGTTTWSDTLDTTDFGWHSQTLRQVITASTSGTRVRVTIPIGTSIANGGGYADNISIVKQEKLKKEWELFPNRFAILMPGRLTNWKGQEKFIEALNILVEDYSNLNFQAIILGSDQGRTVYKKRLVNLVQRYRLNKKNKKSLK